MNKIKQLAGQTAVYGLSSIVGRLLNYLLVPLYTRVFVDSEYGVVTELFAYVVFLNILLTYGMETGFFRFVQKEKKKDNVFSTILTSIFTTSTIFIVLFLVFSQNIADILNYSNHPEYIQWFVIIIGVDAFTAIPFARLRQQNKALKFAVFKLINIGVNIGLNLLFIIIIPWFLNNNPESNLSNYYNHDIGVGYIFISNLIASIVTLLMFIPDLFKLNYSFDYKLLKRILIYSLPLVITGLAGMINEFFDRILLKFWLTVPMGVVDAKEYVLGELGIYGANAKIAVLMTLFVQTFRYAADPFFFSTEKDKNALETYANVMKYFIILGLFIFLGIVLYLDIVKHFIDESYFEGLKVVPLLLLGHFLVGIIYNLSFWYKLKNLTRYGAYIFIIGSVVTIVINFILIPRIGYMGCAWANFICYAIMLLISYFWGRKHLKVPYNLKRIFLYSAIAVSVYIGSQLTEQFNQIIELSINTLILGIFSLIIYKLEGGRKFLLSLKNMSKSRK